MRKARDTITQTSTVIRRVAQRRTRTSPILRRNNNAFVTGQAVTTTQTTPNRSQIMQTPSNPGLVETKISVVRAKTEVAG